MALAETAQLIAEFQLKDSASAPASAAKQEMAGLEQQAQKTAQAVSTSGEAGRGFGDRLEAARPKIREFARAGSELSVVAAVLGNDLNATLGPLGEFIHIAGDAGLVLTAVADLAPAAARGILALGTAHSEAAVATALEAGAAAAAAPAIVAEGAAATTAAGGFSVLALAENAAAAGAGLLATGVAIATAPITLLVGAGIALGVAIHEVSTGFEDFHPKAQKVADDLRDEVQAAQAASRATDELNKLTGDARIHAAELILQQLGLNDVLAQYERQLIALGVAQNNDSFTATELAGSAKDAADAAETHRLRLLGEATAIDGATSSSDALKASLDALPRNIDINVNLKLNSSSTTAAAADVARLRGLGEDTGNLNQFGGAAVQPFSTSKDIIDPGVVAFNEAQRRAREAANRAAASAADEAARKAKQRAEELARAYRNDVDDAFATAKRTSESLFDSLHDRNLQAVKDAETLAQKNHDGAIQKIQDDLKAQQSANAQPVTAAQAALSATQNAHQLRDLQEALNAAFTALQQNADPTKQADLEKSLRGARESLSDFQAQQNINGLRQTQTNADAAAQAAANLKTKNEDAALATAERQARLDTAAENTRNKDTVARFEQQLAALRVADLKAHKSTSDIDADIEALQKRNGIFTDAQGFHHIADPLVQAIRDVKIPTPTFIQHITYTTPPIFLNGRLVAAAQAQQVNVTQSTTVRGGQQRPTG